MLDYSSAFDTVDHDILLKILELTFGVSGLVLDWIKSYLNCRVQVVCINGKRSSLFIVIFGVPQGSVLGPLLYIIYTADIVNVIKKHGFLVHIYADDSQLYMHIYRQDVLSILPVIELCVDDIQQWSSSRRLKLNASKTEFIVFDRTGLFQKKTNNVTLNFGTTTVMPVKVVRDLGVLLDSNLSLKANISLITKSCFYQLRRLRQVKKHLDEDSLKMLIHALILTRLDYCNSILSGLPISTISPLTRVLHATARLVTGLRRGDHITPILRKLHWLPVEARIQFKLCVLMHGVFYKRCPKYLEENMTLCSDVPGRAGHRSSSQCHFVQHRTELKFGERTFTIAGPKAWNLIPLELKQIEKVDSFRKKLKAHFFKLYLN
jgi:hypothetical protein